MTARVVRTPEALVGARRGSWGFVPTMGALHAGHLTLISRAAAENDIAAVSIFVNPAQFENVSDLSRYPRDVPTDVARAEAAGARIIYAPEVSTMYPPGFSTWVEPGALADGWEGKSRPGHFRGVATVVSILLNAVRAERAYFGEKDIQQLRIIQHVHRDLRLPGQIIPSPTVRDVDGLALSSRNARLSAEGRHTARKIPQALAAIVDAAQVGVTEIETLERIGRGVVDDPGLRLDYLAIVDDQTLVPEVSAGTRSRIVIAAEVDGVRLIDNVALPWAAGVQAVHSQQ